MAFKLGSNRGSRDSKLNIGSKETISGCRIERVELPEGVMGESHKEGVIYILFILHLTEFTNINIKIE